MKKLIVLSAIATLTSGAALASDISVNGSVQSVCEVTNVDSSSVAFPSLVAGATSDFDFSMKCNDYDGATVKLTSSEGHMQTVDGLDATGVGYTALLDAAPYNFTLSATTGSDDLSESQSKPGSAAFASGITGNILLTVVDTPIFSGNYTDQLSLTVTAN
ncbi:hypothetical protein GCM10009112_10910 [Marinomonas arenicola]|uniref:hypothetical protein n=1 Tax=Marinomonas TaxID=28253 RepID=UPI001054EBE1|nr:hypothetical protein [Marinomonas sp. KMM3893]